MKCRHHRATTKSTADYRRHLPAAWRFTGHTVRRFDSSLLRANSSFSSSSSSFDYDNSKGCCSSRWDVTEVLLWYAVHVVSKNCDIWKSVKIWQSYFQYSTPHVFVWWQTVMVRINVTCCLIREATSHVGMAVSFCDDVLYCNVLQWLVVCSAE